MGTAILMHGVTTGGTESAIAQIDVPKDGLLIGIEWGIQALFDTTSDSLRAQVSFGSVAVGTNDSRQVVSVANLGAATFTAGGSIIAGDTHYASLPDIPVGAGERLYLHSIGAAGVVATIQAVLHFDFDLDQPKARRR